ncbi:MAG: InlB B-repeat-containing protein [Evtepia sp.]
MVLSLVPMSALAAGDPSNDSNNPNTAVNAIVNGSFEQPGRTDKNAPQLDDVPGWSTTATDHLIEFGVNTQANSAPQLSGNDKSIPDGNQFAELNADEVSTLYQNVSTVGGHIYEWGLSHRGREGKDTMALIIGPKQANAPAKPDEDENGQDQFMRLTDWVQRNAETLGVTVPRDGCSQRITVYSKKFDENGGFLNNPGNESPFSTAPSNLYTETWSVWIIATGNQSWGSYGTHDPTYDPLQGIGGGIGCSYTVPVGQKETTFAFCSYSSSGSGGLTVGNLLDNITFSLYHNVTFTTTAGGEGTVSAEIQGATQTVDFSDKNAIDVPVRNNRQMILTAPATADSGVTTFVGAYITQHRTDGSFTEFVDKSKWTPNGTTYTYTGTVTAPTDVVLVFVRSPAVTYDANGGDRYVHTRGAKEPTDVVSFGAGTGQTSYTSHAATASKKKGWVFAGWLLARAENGGRVLPEKHTVSYDAEKHTFTFAYADGDTTTTETLNADGVALLAQWRWQQTFQTQLQQGDTVKEDKACGTITTKDGQTAETYDAATGEQVTVTANANSGYAFLGWYRTIDGQLQLVSQEQTYAYTVGKQGVQTVYARFAKTYTITYTWDTSNSPTDQIAPVPGTATEGTTYPLSVPQQTTVSATVNGVPGHWLFQGWKEQGGTEYLGQEIANVTRNYTLVGSWSFIPNNRYRLTYDVGNHNTNWIPSGLGAVVQSNPLHYYQETVTSAAAPTIPAAENTILAANGTTFQGTWTFQGWKRSDTGDPAGTSFTMPNHDLTLTAQWEFTPNTYKVAYNLNNGTEESLAGHDSYTYPEIEGKTGVDTSKPGIPFGASLIVKDFTGTVPDGKYFAGWGLQRDATALYEPGQRVNNKSLKVTTNGDTITLYAIYKDIGTVTVEFAGNDANRGSVSVRQGSFSEINGTLSGATVKSEATAKPGYHFTGWKCETRAYLKSQVLPLF